MAIRDYNRYFGNKRGAGAEVKRAMEAQYGKQKGDRIFYALANKRKRRRRRQR